MLQDTLSDTLSVIKNAERAGKRECVTRPASKMVRDVLRVMQKHRFIGDFEFIEDGRGGKFKVQLTGRINDCNAVRPRFFTKKGEYEAWEKRFLPAAGVGILIVSTAKGVVSHREVRGKEGGTLLAFVY